MGSGSSSKSKYADTKEGKAAGPGIQVVPPPAAPSVAVTPGGAVASSDSPRESRKGSKRSVGSGAPPEQEERRRDPFLDNRYVTYAEMVSGHRDPPLSEAQKKETWGSLKEVFICTLTEAQCRREGFLKRLEQVLDGKNVSRHEWEVRCLLRNAGMNGIPIRYWDDIDKTSPPGIFPITVCLLREETDTSAEIWEKTKREEAMKPPPRPSPPPSVATSDRGSRRPSKNSVASQRSASKDPYQAAAEREQRKSSKQSVESAVIAETVEEIRRKFPDDEYEMTMFAVLPRLRPGEDFTLQDFKERKTLNGMTGVCKGHDADLHCWTLMLEDTRQVRVVPPGIAKAMLALKLDEIVGGKPIEGFITYADNIIQVVLEVTEKDIHRHVKERAEVVQAPTPAKQVVRNVKQDADEEPKAPQVKRKVRPRKTASLDSIDDQEEPAESGVKFEVGDMVMMKDAGGARLGVGKIKEMGDKPGFVRVEFGQRGGVINLETTELEPFTRSRKSAKGLNAKLGMQRRSVSLPDPTDEF